MPDAKPYHALIVEDTEDIIGIMQITLEHLGIESSTARTGPQALELLTHRIPDLLLLDIGLPGMNGWELLEEIKTRHPDADFPVIVLTAFTDPANRLIGKFQVRVVHYIVKPFEVTDLLAAIRSTLNL
jgi:CheY-like chemotaxis protein